ncbi:hypothetical protein [Streptomyces sp. Midd1]|uniref:hypothetical protein n=1 Tax=Streptomyces sp. Midd3 TaxID=3161191 RepID=UPI0034DACA03
MEDPRLWAIAYIEFFVQDQNPESRKNRLTLEQDSVYMCKAVGNFAMFLMDAVWLPVNFQVHWTDSWVEFDALRRTSPALREALSRRDRYRRLGLGHTGCPRLRLRQTARDVVGMLWVAYQAECAPEPPQLYGSQPVVEMLHRYRMRFGQTSGPGENA